MAPRAKVSQPNLFDSLDCQTSVKVAFGSKRVSTTLSNRAESVVYFIRVGKFIKIGVTTNLKKRIQALRGASNEQIYVLLTIPGDRRLERRLHELFGDARSRNEFFHYDARIQSFIGITEYKGAAAALAAAESWHRETERECIAEFPELDSGASVIA
jgi:hypothetical protein